MLGIFHFNIYQDRYFLTFIFVIPCHSFFPVRLPPLCTDVYLSDIFHKSADKTLTPVFYDLSDVFSPFDKTCNYRQNYNRLFFKSAHPIFFLLSDKTKRS